MQRLIFIVFLSLLFCAAPSVLLAQTEVQLDVLVFPCEDECVSISANGEFPDGASFSWVFLQGFDQPPIGDTLSHIITEGPYVDWCEGFQGFYIAYLEVTDVDGNMIAVGQVSFDVFYDIQGSVFAYGSHQTACEQDSFAVFYPGNSNDCYDVCVGSTSTLTIDEIQATGPNGGIYTIDPNQGQWSVNGGQLVTNPVDPNEEYEDFTLTMDEVYANNLELVCVPIRIHEFELFSELDFTINYNANALTYVGAQDFHTALPNLSAENVNNVFPGAINFAWGTDIEPVFTIGNGDLLFEVCFEVNNQLSSFLSFQEISAASNGLTIMPDTRGGAVLFEETSTTSISILWEEEGTGNVTFSGWYINEFGCENYYDLNFCFNVEAPPSAEIITQPALNPNGILEVCEGQIVYFSNETDGVDSYLWHFGDGAGASIQSPTHAYNTAGTYEVQLITSTGCECVDTSRVTVIVEGNEAPFVDCVATICEGTSVTYSANTNCDSYTWSISANGVILDGGGVNDDFITIEWGSGPIGEITLETDGCPDLSTCTEAAYLQVPIVSAMATIEGPERVCQGERTIYTLPPFEGVEFNWNVSPFGTIVEGQGTASVTIEWSDGPIPSNAQTVSVDYNNCYLECGGSATKNVFIRPAFYASGAIEVCENTSSDYSVVNTQTNAGFLANFNVENASGVTVWTSPTAAAMATIDWNFGAGHFTVVAIPQDVTAFCKDIYSFQVKVTPQPAAPEGILGQNQICAGIPYTYAVENPVDGERYHWVITNGADVSERDGNSITVNWGLSEPYTLSLSRLSPPLFCPSAPTDLTVSPVTDFSISGDPAVCLDQLASYTSNQTGDVYYNWSISPANAGTITGDPSQANIEVLWHNPGIATVALEICGQQRTFEVDVHAPPQPVVNAPNALCAGVTEAVSTAQVYSSYSWQNEEGIELSNDPSPSLGGGYYRLVVTDDIGCEGATTFYIYPYPPSEINISTPDPNVFCNTNSPSTHLYAINTEDSYTFQWLMDGMPIAGETGTNYAATAYGLYQVEIIDENACSYLSNAINVYEDCGGGGGPGGGPACPNADHNFTSMDNGSCNERSYTANATGSNANSILWFFDDPGSGSNTATGNNVNHTFSSPGFYRVSMRAQYDVGGDDAVCRSVQVDTIYAVAAFDYTGVCPGLPVQFYDLSTFLPDFTSIIDWNWDFGDPTSGSNMSTAKDPVHTFTGEGIYNVSLTVTTTNGCTASITKEVLIYPLPFTNFNDPDASCSLMALEFVADVESTVSSILWSFGDAASGAANNSTLFTSYHAYDTPGAYTVNLEATSVYGCVNNFSNTIDITPSGLSGDIDPVGLSMLCEGDDLMLTAPTSVATEWLWSTAESTQSINVNEAGTYSVTLTSAEGCVYTPEPAAVDIIPAPQSPIRSVTYNDYNQAENYTYETIAVCEGEEVFLETSQQAGYAYSWSTGDTDNTTEFTEDRGNILSQGEHTISLTVTDTNSGCSAVEVFTVIVNPTPAIPFIDFSGQLCAGTSTTLSVNSPNADYTYIWSNGDAGASITTDIGDEYIVTTFNLFGCTAESSIVEIFEGPDISLVPNGCHTRCAPDTLCMPQIPNVISYQWYQDGMLIPAPEGTVTDLVIQQSGSYTLEMEDVNGCVQISNPLNIDILPGYGTISGTVYFDDNDNEMIDAGDVVAENIIISLENMTSPINDLDTDGLGNYGFANIPEDDYTLSIDTLSVPEGWKAQMLTIDTTFVGCDQEVEVNWLLVPDCFDTTFVAAVCPDEDYIFQGDAYPIGSNQTVVTSAAVGCDSTFVFSVEALPSSSEMLEAEICPDASYTYNGVNYAAGTDQIFEFTNTAGCDSTIQLVVTTTEEANIETNLAMSCPNVNNGSIKITSMTGTTPFVFALNDDNLQTVTEFTDLNPGIYDLHYEDANGCQYEEELTIETQASLVAQLEDVIIPCDQASVMIQPEIHSGDDGNLQFIWSDGFTGQERPVAEFGMLELEVANACEQQSFAIEVKPEVEARGHLIYVPNAFSPNGDGNNDVFEVYPGDEVQVENLDFQVFDRWGALIYDSSSFDDGWKGKARGVKAKTGVYLWRLNADINLCGQAISLNKQGEVLLVR